MTHSALPWAVSELRAFEVQNVYGHRIVDCCSPETGDRTDFQNARLIVRAVNSHEALVKALEEIHALCMTDPANPFLADNMDRIAIAALQAAKGGE